MTNGRCQRTRGNATSLIIGLDPGIVVKYGLGLSDSQTDLGQFVPTNHAAPGFPLVTALAGDCHALDPYFDSTGYIGLRARRALVPALRSGPPRAAERWR